ncbi:unnamed protein product [Linum trigynum]|uniref:Uncharacterized protein n=1 Tax=Linum trigynum TaxID=586398 RepID=A0AAV2FAZ0_9ROSI
MGGRDLVMLPFRHSGTRSSRADFAVTIHESRPQTSSRSVCTMVVFWLGKLSVSPLLLLHEVRALSPPIRGRNLGLPGRDLHLDA